MYPTHFCRTQVLCRVACVVLQTLQGYRFLFLLGGIVTQQLRILQVLHGSHSSSMRHDASDRGTALPLHFSSYTDGHMCL